MKSESMEAEEIEAVLEKIWDLHDKLSDAIHSISRAHFLNSIKSQNAIKSQPSGFVYLKGFHADDSAIAEAKSLNHIRTALENLEEHLVFLHTVQSQQQTEMDTALARLEQCRVSLAMRLADHHGKKYKVIEEACAFVGDVHDESRVISPENLFRLEGTSNEISVDAKGNRSNILINSLFSHCNFIKKLLKLDEMGAVLGNASMVAITMLAVIHNHQLGRKDKFVMDLTLRQDASYSRDITKVYQPESSSSGDGSKHLDVLLARG